MTIVLFVFVDVITCLQQRCNAMQARATSFVYVAGSTDVVLLRADKTDLYKQQIYN